MKDLIVFSGGIFRDMVAVTPSFPKPGETVFGQDFFTGFGGKSSNQSVACRLLGGKVAMVGKLGSDDNGEAYRAEFQRLAIDTSHLGVVEGAPSGVASILVHADTGENQIVIVPGANTRMTADDIERARDLFERAALVVCAQEMPLEAIKASFKIAKECGAKTLFNAAPARAVNDQEMLNHVDILCVNETEAATMTGLQVESPDEAKLAAQALLKCCPTVLVTLGAKGAIVATKDEIVHVPIVDEATVVDTTGAGDAFVGSLAYFLTNLPTLALKEQVKRACQVATLSVQRRGTQSSYPSRTDLPLSLFNTTDS